MRSNRTNLIVDGYVQVSQMPWIDTFWNKNPVLAYFRPPTASPIMDFAVKRANERQHVAELSNPKALGLGSRDFLSRFIEAKLKDPHVPD